jgi:hypothetical protein
MVPLHPTHNSEEHDMPGYLVGGGFGSWWIFPLVFGALWLTVIGLFLWRRSSRVVAAVIAGGVVAAASFAAVIGASAAATSATASVTALSTTAPSTTPGGAGVNPWSVWGSPDAGSAWSGFGPDGWGPAPAEPTERSHVASTNPAGPGAIIVTGVINAGGIEHPGRAVDNAVIAGITFRIDHSAGQPTVRFDPKTCVGTITQTGPFTVSGATGSLSPLNGSGTYWFNAEYTTARSATGCTQTMTAYIETINGIMSVNGGPD